MDARGLASVGEQQRSIRRAVVNDQPLDLDIQLFLVRHRRQQEAHRRIITLIGTHLHKAQAGLVVDGHVGVLPVCASTESRRSSKARCIRRTALPDGGDQTFEMKTARRPSWLPGLKTGLAVGVRCTLPS